MFRGLSLDPETIQRFYLVPGRHVMLFPFAFKWGRRMNQCIIIHNIAKKRALIAPGEFGELPEDHRSVFGRIRHLTCVAEENGRLVLNPDFVKTPDFPWEAHFDGGLQEAEKWVSLFNRGLRTYPYDQQDGDLYSAQKALALQSPANGLSRFVVLYRTNSSTPADPPFGMLFYAENADHAEEQLVDAEPDADVVWVYEGKDYQQALEEYFSVGQPEPEYYADNLEP